MKDDKLYLIHMSECIQGVEKYTKAKPTSGNQLVQNCWLPQCTGARLPRH